MAEKRLYNAKMNAKGLEKSVSEEQARGMALHQGSTSLFIVQAHAGPKVVNEDGSEVVSLIPDVVELVPEEHAERLRVYQRALYLARPEQFGQEAFETAGPGEPDADAAVADIEALVEKDAAGEPTGIWDPGAEATVPSCPAPDCDLAEGHDGDHQAENKGADVVAFSGGKG
jgi:hypothetical protein